jgi:hypothetical protein
MGSSFLAGRVSAPSPSLWQVEENFETTP